MRKRKKRNGVVGSAVTRNCGWCVHASSHQRQGDEEEWSRNSRRVRMMNQQRVGTHDRMKLRNVERQLQLQILSMDARNDR